MAEPLLECVPNVSEGTDRAILGRLGDAVAETGARLVDVHADPDHHRAVFTVLGPAPAVEAAALALGRATVDLVDVRRHVGVHPRIGALDVLPFVPLGGLPMAEAVAAAHRVGRRFAEACDVPVFFYEAAALVPERRPLPAVRAGGFERLAARFAGGERPDAGPAHPHPSAGATAVGARRFLIAFNAVLDTAEAGVARAIAAAIRQTAPGGLPGVRALGLPLPSRGLAQVSMNLLDYRRTPPRRVVERLEAEAAARAGVRIIEYELVGCAPADAFAGIAGSVARLQPSQLLDPALFADP
jgi:glutamate formiminotransferase / 5-formyltetrahydrofolate cyclo-ligase